MTCAFCGQPAEARCTRLITDFMPTLVENIPPGTVVRRLVEKRKTARVAVMLERRYLRLDRWKVLLKIRDARGQERVKQFITSPRATMLAERTAACGLAVCECCHVAPGDETVWCRTHWQASASEMNPRENRRPGGSTPP